MAEDYRGIEYLRRKLKAKAVRVNTRYKFYELKNMVRDLGISTPPKLRAWNSSLGWCAHAVDDLADRLLFREFREDILDMNDIYNRNNPDVIFDSAILSAMIGSCSFIYISQGENDFPRLQVIDGANATGIIDELTGMLKEGYAVLKRDDRGNPIMEAYFTPEETIWLEDGEEIRADENITGYPLLVPVIYRPDAKRPFGHSRISRACMSYAEAAIRTIKRAEISAEFYSFPQKYVTGLAQDYEITDAWSAAMSAFISISKDDEGEQPKFGQFQQQSMTPHMEQLRMFASLFAGETSLTLDDLGFPSDNPSSSEAIKAAHESLRLKARKAQRTFGSGFLNAGFLAACMRDGNKFARDAIYMTKPIWEPIFEPDASSIGLIGDGLIKLNQAVPGFVTPQTVQDITGISPEV